MSNDHSLQNLWSINNVKKYTIKTNQKRSANSFLYIEVKAAQRQRDFLFFFRSKTKNKKLLIWGFLIKWKEEMENKFFETIFAKYHSRIGRISQKGCDFQINKKDAK